VDSDAAVALAGVSRRFGAVTAVHDISLTVDRGELFGFIGPDGAGKTTLFRILATLLVPTTGTAIVLGRNVVDDYRALRRAVGYMPGRFSLYPDLSVHENLDFFASVFGTSIAAQRTRIAPIYSQLEPFRDRKASALSGGMKQKLALCCALVHEPEILLLDEPTTGVDAVSRREFWDLLGQLKRGGLTVVVSTPYMDEADRCDRIALIQNGRLLGIDTPAAIVESFDRPLFAVRSAERYRSILALREFAHAAAVYPFGEVLHYVDARANASSDTVARDVERYLGECGLQATVEITTPSIEDSFIARMQRLPAADNRAGVP
jgi:ABC-type multidrug transport system ATPase subunit